MHLHEYQSKELLKQIGIAVCEGFVIDKLDQLEMGLLSRSWASCVLKAQIHSGARGKAGAVRLTHSLQEANEQAKKMLGARFITEQTGPLGKIAEKLLVCPIVSIEKEYYLALTYDRAMAAVCLIASCEGGIHVEKKAKEAQTSQGFCKIHLPWNGKLRLYQKRQVAKTLQTPENQTNTLYQLLDRLTCFFFDCDVSLLEINPLALTSEGELLVLDAKLSIDDNALYRQPKLASLKDPSQLAPGELEAQLAGLSYVAMEGSIGCMVNGAGLAMATLDLLEAHGLKAANFLDVGGGADLDRIKKGFELLAKDPHVQVIFVHIFGGIMDCRLIIRGFLEASVVRHLPLIIRMEGNHVEEAKELLKASSLAYTFARNLDEAALLCRQNLEATTLNPRQT